MRAAHGHKLVLYCQNEFSLVRDRMDCYFRHSLSPMEGVCGKYDPAASVVIVAACFGFREVARDGMLCEKRK